uniref:Major antigen n=2 Tax=Parascaris univalens TaxID=6257 RepID=A0A915BWR6_PARUN
MENVADEENVMEEISETMITSTEFDKSSGAENFKRQVVDTSDVPLYERSGDLVDAVVLLPSSCGGVARFERAQQDLSNFKKRIDANTEEQREHADLMVALQRKIEEYRHHLADIENQVITHKDDGNIFFNIKEHSEMWVPDLKAISADFEFANLLEEERRRNGELRMQLTQQQTEIQRLRQQFQMSIHDKEKTYQIRERNLAQYLGDEQQKMTSLWSELQQLRAQFADYREQTERDLEHQRNEFARVTRNVGGVVRKLSITSLGAEGGVVQYNELIQAAKRFCEQQLPPAGVSADEYNALMKKYEEAIERIVEWESREDGSGSKIPSLEAELKRTKQKLEEYQQAFRKLYDMTKEADTKSGLKKRPRSLSPGSTRLGPSEVVRNLRYVLRTRDNELQQLQRNLNNAKQQIVVLTSNYEIAEEARKRLEKELVDAKKEIISSQKSLDETTREVKRLEDRLHASESQNAFTEGVHTKLEDEIRRLKIIIEQSNVDGTRKALEEAEAQNDLIEDDYKARISELTRRMELIQEDNKRLKSDLATVKEKHRSLELEHNAVLRMINEKDIALQSMENVKDSLMKDLENQRVRFDAVTNELDNLQTNFDSNTRNTMAIEMTVKEIRQQRDNISKEKEDLSKRLVDLSRRLAIEIKKREEIERTSHQNLNEAGKLKEQLANYEKQLLSLRCSNEEQDTKLKTSVAKITTLETSLTSAQKEITKLTELNDKLQSEKQDIMNLRQKTDVELDALKDKMRKLEQEIEKLKSENSLLHEGENQIQKAYKEEVNKVHQLVLELKEAKAEIDELERKLAQINEENQLRLENALQAGSSSDRVNTYEITEITETKIKQLGDQHKLDIQRLENERDDLARRVHQLEDELIEKQHAINAQLTEISDMKSRYEADTEKLQTDFKDLIAKHQSELDDVHDQHSHEVETFRIQEDELRNKVTLLEKKLEDAQNDEKLLRKEINEWEEKYNTLNNELQVVRDQLENMRCDTEKEIQKWKTELYTVQMELKNVEATNETVRSQLVIANERANSLNKTVSDRTAKIRELNAEMRRREEELADTKATVASLETDLTDANRRLKTIEEQYATLKLDNNKILAESDTFKRQFDVLSNTKASNESEIERLKKKIGQMTAIINEHVDEHGQLRNNRDELEKICYEKTKLTDQLNETVKTLESKAERSHRELQILSDKFVVSESEKNALRTQVNKLEQELQFGRELLIRKTNEFHIALEDLAGAHRIAEDGRVNALQELETKKFETADLQSRLENAEQRLSALQQEYLNTDKEKDMLNEALHRFQCVISRAMIPEIGDAIDLPTIDIQVQKLITRIEKLERERNQYRDSLGRLQRKTSDSNMAISKHENLYKSIEERVVDIEEEKRSLETKLSSAKELLRSQEEALKQRDDERRTMKQKIITYDLESRGKDAQIRHLNELVKTLRSELESAQNDSRVLRNREEQWDTNKILLESKVRDHEAETQKMNMLIATFETERGNLNDSVKKLSAQLLDSEAKNADLKDDAERLKRDLVKAAKVETDLRRSLEEQTRIARECQHLRDQLGITKNDLSNSNCRKQQLECELSSTRSELRENKQNLRDSMNRISDLDKQLQNALSDKNRLNDRINELGKVISSEHATESELRQKLLTTNSELNTTQGEVEDLRRRIAQFDIYKHSTNEKAEEMKKIRATLSKKIEILESEKRSAEALISETALQREAIERSLTALERENKELYRNCARLQQQVAQLEMDNGSRLIALTNKQKEDYERFIQTIKAEKAQVERIVENRDRMHKTRIKQLENQLNILREQLNNERIRRRDATDRVLLSDMSKLGGTAFGSFSTGTLSAGANIYPQSTAFDYIVSSGSGFNSHFVTSPPIRSLSPIKDDCYLSSSLNTLKDPATLPPYGMVNEEIKLDKDVEIEDTDSQQEMKKTTIVVHMKGTTKEHESASE